MATAAIEATYEDSVNYINSYAWKFFKQYGGEFDEWVSVGNEIFMTAYQRYNPAKGKWGTWLCFFLHRLMMEKVRRAAMRGSRHKRVSLDMRTVTDRNYDQFDPDTYLASLSDEAKQVVKLIIDSPVDIKHTLIERGGNNKPSDYKAAVKEYLKDIGWSLGDIRSTFQEIREALI